MRRDIERRSAAPFILSDSEFSPVVGEGCSLPGPFVSASLAIEVPSTWDGAVFEIRRICGTAKGPDAAIGTYTVVAPTLRVAFPIVGALMAVEVVLVSVPRTATGHAVVSIVGWTGA